MSKKKEFIVPVFFKIKAKSYTDAEQIAIDIAECGVEIAYNEGLAKTKGWSECIGDLQ